MERTRVQLIVGGTAGQVTALEPHTGQLLAITKTTSSHYSFVTRISDATVAPDARRPAIPGARGPINGAGESDGPDSRPA